MPSQSDVIVVGGGFAGLTVAAAIASRGKTVAIFEANEGALRAFRGELLHPAGVRSLRTLGMDAVLQSAHAVAVKGFAVFERAETDAILLPYAPSVGLGAGFDHGVFISGARQRLEETPGIRLRTRARVFDVVRLNGRVVGVRCGDGSEHRARLLIGADGRFSRFRKLLDIPADAALLSHTIAVAVDERVLPHSGHGHVFVGGPGPVLAYPFGEGRVRVCIDVPIGAAPGRERLVAYVRERYGPYLPAPLRDAVVRAVALGRLAGAPNHAVTAQESTVPGAVLVGDAGGCSHPLAATGMPGALHDAMTFIACLDEEGLTDAACSAYGRRRESFVRARSLFADALFEVLKGSESGTAVLREGLFRYWRESERARRISTRLLSGEESRITSFVSEYTRVALASSVNVLFGPRLLDDPTGVLAELSSLIGTASSSAGTAARALLATRPLSERTLSPRAAVKRVRRYVRRTRALRRRASGYGRKGNNP